MNELDEVIRRLVKFGEFAVFSDELIKRASTELAVLRGELTYYRRMFLEREEVYSEADKVFCSHDWFFPPDVCPVCKLPIPIKKLNPAKKVEVDNGNPKS